MCPLETQLMHLTDGNRQLFQPPRRFRLPCDIRLSQVVIMCLKWREMRTGSFVTVCPKWTVDLVSSGRTRASEGGHTVLPGVHGVAGSPAAQVRGSQVAPAPAVKGPAVSEVEEGVHPAPHARAHRGLLGEQRSPGHLVPAAAVPPGDADVRAGALDGGRLPWSKQLGDGGRSEGRACWLEG